MNFIPLYYYSRKENEHEVTGKDRCGTDDM